MRPDSVAVRSLKVFESRTDQNKNFSLFGLMNHTYTTGMDKRLLNRWHLQYIAIENKYVFVKSVQKYSTLLLAPTVYTKLVNTLGKFTAMVEIAIDLSKIDNREYVTSPSYEMELASLKNQPSFIPHDHALSRTILNVHVTEYIN
ncbi:DNA mismatch repair protein MSH2-like [Carex rostrata]